MGSSSSSQEQDNNPVKQALTDIIKSIDIPDLATVDEGGQGGLVTTEQSEENDSPDENMQIVPVDIHDADADALNKNETYIENVKNIFTSIPTMATKTASVIKETLSSLRTSAPEIYTNIQTSKRLADEIHGEMQKSISTITGIQGIAQDFYSWKSAFNRASAFISYHTQEALTDATIARDIIKGYAQTAGEPRKSLTQTLSLLTSKTDNIRKSALELYNSLIGIKDDNYRIKSNEILAYNLLLVNGYSLAQQEDAAVGNTEYGFIGIDTDRNVIKNVVTKVIQKGLLDKQQRSSVDGFTPEMHVVEHIRLAVTDFFIKRMGRSVVQGGEIPQIKMGIPDETSQMDALRIIAEKLYSEDVEKNITRITGDEDQLIYFMMEIINEMHDAANKNSSGDPTSPMDPSAIMKYLSDSKYFGKPATPIEFAERLVGENGSVLSEFEYNVSKYSKRLEFYSQKHPPV